MLLVQDFELWNRHTRSYYEDTILGEYISDDDEGKVLMFCGTGDGREGLFYDFSDSRSMTYDFDVHWSKWQVICW